MLGNLTSLAVCYYSFGQSINITNLLLVEITNGTAKTVHEYGKLRIYMTSDVKGKSFSKRMSQIPTVICLQYVNQMTEANEMNLRTNYRAVSPGAFKAMMAMEQYISGQFEDKVLYELLKIRVSQINGCAFCLDMHAKDLMKMGDTRIIFSC